MITPGDPGPHDFLFTLDSTGTTHPISPYIYGSNESPKPGANLTLYRTGGNRLSAYNWETNASNAGSDYLYENDNFLSSSKVAGAPMQEVVAAANDAGASTIMTVPMAGWVSANENGPCPSQPTAAQIAQNFFPLHAAKGAPFIYPPDTTDSVVYADEFVWWLESQFPNAQTDPRRRTFYMLDNEPDLWSSTHSEIHPAAATYAELIQDTIAFATAIKAVAPAALIFGPVDYGWEGYVTLQNASDANHRDWLDTFLAALQAADTSAGKRLLDVLDVHWYPEATGGGTRITSDGTSPAEVAARLQAPRSLWDPSYIENSWITNGGSGPAIQLIPLLQGKIAKNYPGTSLSISEYNYGAGSDISGGIAQADVLGIFGSYGLFAASLWVLSTSSYIDAAFAMYRNYDGQKGVFGDTSITATTSAPTESSVYASVASANPANVIVVALNKDTSAKVAGITVKHRGHLTGAQVYTLTSAAGAPQSAASLVAAAPNAFSYTMPARSVSTLVFHP